MRSRCGLNVLNHVLSCPSVISLDKKKLKRKDHHPFAVELLQYSYSIKTVGKEKMIKLNEMALNKLQLIEGKNISCVYSASTQQFKRSIFLFLSCQLVLKKTLAPISSFVLCSPPKISSFIFNAYDIPLSPTVRHNTHEDGPTRTS